MMKMTKRNWTIAIIYAMTLVIGNIGTNRVIAKNNTQLDTEYQIAKSNLIWQAISLVTGIIINKTLIEK